MGRLFLLCLLLIGGNLRPLYAQGDFAPIGAKWYYSWASSSDTGDPERKIGYFKLESIGDTTLNGQSCRKLQKTLYAKEYSHASAPVDTSVSTLFIYSESDTVFYFEEILNRFIPLYIFNVNVNDTISYRKPPSLQSSPADSIFKMKVTDITYDAIGGTQVKTIHHEALGVVGFGVGLSTPYTTKMGVMNEFLLCHRTGGVATVFTPRIRCYFDDEMDYISDPNSTCDYIEGTNDINSLPNIGKDIVIFPNPTSGLLHIRSDAAAIKRVFIYTMLGKEVVHSVAHGYALSFDLSVLPKGLYFLKIETEQNTRIAKINIL